MNKNRPNPPAAEREAASASQRRQNRPPGQWPAAVRLGISLLVMWHVAAVFLAPLSIAPSSPLALDIAQGTFMQNYLDALYLNHGYHFFAPDPGPGRLIHYWVYNERGDQIDEGEFPNRDLQWPRLLYHRYFMLAEQGDAPIWRPTEAESRHWRQAYLTAYARQLLREHDAAAVRVQRILHLQLSLEHALEGKTLTDPEDYRREEEVVQRRQDMELPPPPPPSGAWNNNLRRDVASGWQGGWQ